METITIPQQTASDIKLIELENSVIIEQDGKEEYLEKRNIKTFISQLILLDNENTNNTHHSTNTQ